MSMAAFKSLWERLSPYAKAAVGGITGSTVLVGTVLLGAMLVDLTDGSMTDWLALKRILWLMWGLGMVVVGCVYWMHSPKGREVWTDEQREALKDIKEGKL